MIQINQRLREHARQELTPIDIKIKERVSKKFYKLETVKVFKKGAEVEVKIDSSKEQQCIDKIKVLRSKDTCFMIFQNAKIDGKQKLY